MRKIQRLVLLTLLLFCPLSWAAEPIPVPAPPDLPASSYLLVDFHSGRELASKNPDQRLDPASLTKLMTVYIAFHELKAGHLSMETPVRVSEKAWRAEGSRMFIEVGSKVTIGELLQGIIVQSGNDASIAIAEHIAGSEATFAQLMNQYAAKLGMSQTHFTNATGLPHEQHYSTARDLSKLAAALIREFPDYYRLYSEREYSYNGITQYNRNKLLWRDSTVDGLKTGHTQAAGYCLVTSAEREGMRLVSVLLGASSEDARADQSQALLNYGFRFFETRRLYQANATLHTQRVWKGESESLPLGLMEDLYVTIPRGQYDSLKGSMNVNSQIMAPVAAHKQVGDVVVTLGGEVVRKAPLVALSAVPEGGWWSRTVDEVLLWFE